MPIMAASESSDARRAARLLARATENFLIQPSASHDQEVALNNMYRLLERFRTNLFFGKEPPSSPREAGRLTLMPPTERYVKEVSLALQRAVQSVFEDKERDSAVQFVEDYLRLALRAGGKRDPGQDDEKTRVLTFLQVFADELSAEQ
jgi:hypothetical protein